jgi:hypothetical protein
LFPELAIFLQLIADNWPITAVIVSAWSTLRFKPRRKVIEALGATADRIGGAPNRERQRVSFSSSGNAA